MQQFRVISAMCILAVVTLPAATVIATALPRTKHPITFAGRIESIDNKMRTVAVQHGVIPGYMPAMTMDYPVEDSTILKDLAPSDEITATVYVGDPVLHSLRIVKRGRKTPK